MPQLHHPGGDEPDFANDPLADMVLHKDDEHLAPLSGEAEHLPDGQPVEEWTGDGVNNGDCWFPIHFSYQDTNYTADVQQKTGMVKEYHVSGVSPAIDHLPDPYVVAEHISRTKYDFPVNESWYPIELGNTIVLAIEDGSNQRLRNKTAKE